MIPIRTVQPIGVRFAAKFTISPDSGCWLWTGAVDQKGYGVIHLGNQQGARRAHRVSWMIFHGKIAEGALVCHKCDTPRCVNPGHLFLGSAQDNSSDMQAKNRASRRGGPRGESHYKAVLTRDSVREIRELRMSGMTYKNLARKFNASETAVRHAAIGFTWKEQQS